MTTAPGSDTARLRLTVGPLLYHWPRAQIGRFYDELARTPVDSLVLGEIVCSRRHDMKPADWLALARELRAAGKEVVLGSLALLESEAELRALRALCSQDEFPVEAGDAAALGLLEGRPFVIGPHINVYNRQALQLHADWGAVRWVAPVEMPLSAIGRANPPDDRVRSAAAGGAVQTEVWGFGRQPLAFSARCFTARHHQLGKDDCAFRCADAADGLLLSSSEGQPFLALNGIQTQAAAQACLLGEGRAMRDAGVASVRLSPCSQGFLAVVDCFDRVLRGGASPEQALRELESLALPGGFVNGFALGAPGLQWTRPGAGTAATAA